ncbi:hypothetical protein HHX47_DHR1000809 [Lentinula edodes]|nr:hypothetical protein HHX47_DHR1000809 [Lentinula edodes]
MAEDAIALLNYLGFTEPRSIHVVGLSLGGMISQGTWNFLQAMTFMKDPAQKIPILLDLLYTSPWIDEKAVDDPRGRTNREVEFEVSNFTVSV